jgi:hypothetical protein
MMDFNLYFSFKSQGFYIVSELDLRSSHLLLRGSKCKRVLVPSVVFSAHLYLYLRHFCGCI